MLKTQPIPKITLTTRIHVTTRSGTLVLHSHNWMIINTRKAA
jgi:hypothetical protein